MLGSVEQRIAIQAVGLARDVPGERRLERREGVKICAIEIQCEFRGVRPETQVVVVDVAASTAVDRIGSLVDLRADGRKANGVTGGNS